jgi:hypothetical protein
MKTHKETKKEVVSKVLTSCLCDFCDKEIEARSNGAEEDEVRNVFDLDDYGSGYLTTTVQLRYSQGYPEGTNCYEYSVDICPTCFKTQILDKAKRFSKEETDY